MKPKVMRREIRVFFSVIVWLFSVTGADGAMVTRPENLVLMRGSEATLHCASDSDATKPVWTFQTYINGGGGEGMAATKDDCKSASEFINPSKPDPKTCNLIIKKTLEQSTYKYTCKVGAEKASVIVIVIDLPMYCDFDVNQYLCAIDNSAYMNKSAIVTPYLSSRVIWKDANGNIFGSKYADFKTAQTSLRALTPAAATVDRPHLCSAEFKMMGNLGTEYSSVVNIVPGGKLECRYSEKAKQEQVTKVAVTSGNTATTGFRYSNMGRVVTRPYP